MTIGRRGAATLEITPLLDGGRRIAVRCQHGTATGGSLDTAPLNDVAIVAYLVQRHRQGFGCCCACKLEREFPPALIPLGVTVVEILP